jgi:hypothetical protein
MTHPLKVYDNVSTLDIGALSSSMAKRSVAFAFIVDLPGCHLEK